MRLVKKNGYFYVLQSNDRICLLSYKGKIIENFKNIEMLEDINYNSNIDTVLEDYNDVLGYNVSKFKDIKQAVLEAGINPLHPAIKSCLNSNLVDFGHGRVLVEYKSFMRDSISVGEEYIDLSEFFYLLNEHKDKNKFLWNKIYEENVEYLV